MFGYHIGSMTLYNLKMGIKQIIYSYAEKSRRLMYRLSCLSKEGLFSSGIVCRVEDPTFAYTHGDVIHPCVRYIEEGFEGHQWWMVYTPLYDWNEKLENPRLCYADAPKGQAPTEWKYYCTIIECPEEGYNSDPTLFYKDGKLYVFWRECHTPRVHKDGNRFATYGCTIQNRIVTCLNGPILKSAAVGEDRQLSPTFLEKDGKLYAYTIYLRFDPKVILRLPLKLKNTIYKMIKLTTAFGFYSRMLCYGVAIWEGDSFDTPFKLIKTIKIDRTSWLYNPWHMDLFSVKGNKENYLYSILQSNQEFADICLAESKDGEKFRFCLPQLITEKSVKGLYKSTGQVVNGMFHLYYTANDNSNPSIHKLFLVSENWDSLQERFS